MSAQTDGLLGRIVDRMIRNTVRSRFRNVYWVPPTASPAPPAIFVANHHGWHDGYILYHLVTRLGLPSLDWITEFDAFPLFSKVGGMPFPADDAMVRAATIRKTIRRMREQDKSLVLFAESVLHRPPMVWSFGKALEFVARQVPSCVVIPVAIRYDMSMHERPECFVVLGEPVKAGDSLAERTRLQVMHLLSQVEARMRTEPDSFAILAKGTPDVNERWNMRRKPWQKGHDHAS